MCEFEEKTSTDHSSSDGSDNEDSNFHHLSTKETSKDAQNNEDSKENVFVFLKETCEHTQADVRTALKYISPT